MSASSRYTIWFVIVVAVITVLPSGMSADNDTWWDDEWSSRMEVSIPSSIPLESAVGQPIDMHIDFINPCWARDEKNHSIRIVIQSGRYCSELESQIYDLERVDETHISSCNIIFLIPEDATSDQRFFAYYDSEDKENPGYPDRVDVRDGRYGFEPVPGYAFTSEHFEIVEEDGCISYIISYAGSVLGNGLRLQMIKVAPESKSFSLTTSQAALGPDFWYYPKGEGDPGTDRSTLQHLVSREVVVDGNLMVLMHIVSRTDTSDMQTDAWYRYYHCPSGDGRLVFDITHRIDDDLVVDPGSNFDGICFSLQLGGLQSQSIDELNCGELLPYAHLVDEEGKIREIEIDQNPRYSGGQWDIRLIDTDDDMDLGEDGWICFDQGAEAEGIAHAIMLSSTDVLTSDVDERDGIQLRGYETGYPNLPGLKNQLVGIQLGRNSFESGEGFDSLIDDGSIYSFSGQFFSTYDDGMEGVKDESEIFHALDVLRPSVGERCGSEEPEPEDPRYVVTVKAPLVSSFPLGSLASTISGTKMSYVYAELYDMDEVKIAGDVCRRITFNDLSALFGKGSARDKIRILFGAIDWSNLSLWKSVRFVDVSSGEYLVKVFKMNGLGMGDRSFIGYEKITVDDADLEVSIRCGGEGRVPVGVMSGLNGIGNVEIVLVDGDGVRVDRDITTSSGCGTLYAPVRTGQQYHVEAWYDGMLVSSEDVGFAGSLVLRENVIFEIGIGNLEVRVIDEWDMPFEGDLSEVYLLRVEEERISSINPSEVGMGKLQWMGLLAGEYEVMVKTGADEESLGHVEVSDSNGIGFEVAEEIVYGLLLDVTLDAVDEQANPVDGTIYLYRLADDEVGLEVPMSDGHCHMLVPPGKYRVETMTGDMLVGRMDMEVSDDMSESLVVKGDLSMTLSFLSVLAVCLIACVLWKKKVISIWGSVIIIGAFLSVVSLRFPWWVVEGISGDIVYVSRLWLWPSIDVVSLFSGGGTVAGEVGFLPGEFHLASSALMVMVVSGSSLLIIGIVVQWFDRIRLSGLFKGLGLIGMLGGMVLFMAVLGILLSIGMGGVMGEGVIDMLVPGTDNVVGFSCVWGLGIGFWIAIFGWLLCLFGIVGGRKWLDGLLPSE